MNILPLIPCLLALFLLPSCSFLDQVRQGLEQTQMGNEMTASRVEGALVKANEVVQAANGVYAEIRDTAREVGDLHERAKAQADTDGDGELDPSEWMGYLSLLAAGGVGLAQRKSSKDLNARVDHERRRRKEMGASS